MIQLKHTTPILRIFDEAKARAFYVDYLGFQVDWEHRFGADMPLYMQVSRDACTLHLTEHHGDCTPGSALRVAVEGLEAYHQELKAKGYRFLNPGLEEMPWGSTEMTVIDPFSNRLTFYDLSEEGG